jgi:ferredoxin--NADP+ reductase
MQRFPSGLTASASTMELSEAVDYNATLVEVRRIHNGLAIFRVAPDGGRLDFEPGQYTVLGLHAAEHEGHSVATPLIRRAYSFSCSLLDAQGRVRPPHDFPYLEFYVALVPPHGKRPTLTPRLFALSAGDRLFVGRHPKGEYTLKGMNRTDDVLFIGTGTGEAPHNAMLASLLSNDHMGRIVVATCVRYACDLAYYEAHRELERRYANYRYLPLSTRETSDAVHAMQIISGRRLQDYLTSGDLERDAGLQLAPRNTHVFLCGNPGMIGLPQHTSDGGWQFPKTQGMVELLAARGFTLDKPHWRGNIHVEQYW